MNKRILLPITLLALAGNVCATPASLTTSPETSTYLNELMAPVFAQFAAVAKTLQDFVTPHLDAATSEPVPRLSLQVHRRWEAI